MKLVQRSGWWTVVLAVVHVAAAPVLYPDSLRSILDAGVVGALDADPAQAMLRAAGFWYVSAGLLLGGVGIIVLRRERAGEGAPAGYAWMLAAVGLWGVLITPVSGFWFFFVLAALAWRSRRRFLPQDRTVVTL